MNKQYINFGGITCLIIGVYFMSYLLNNNALPCSINSVEISLNHWIRHWHIIIVALMPIYVGFTLFGTAIGSLLFGTTLQHWLTYLLIKRGMPSRRLP
jgi:hypothetical protein